MQHNYDKDLPKSTKLTTESSGGIHIKLAFNAVHAYTVQAQTDAYMLWHAYVYES